MRSVSSPPLEVPAAGAGPTALGGVRTALDNPLRARATFYLYGLLPAALLIVPVAALVVSRRFDGLYGQDAFAYFDYAVGPFRASLLALHLVPPPDFFWPPGFPALIGLLSLLTGPVTLAGQVVSLAMGVLAACMTALVARELISDHLAAAIAGVLVAVAAQLVQSSAVIMSDTTALGLACLGAWSTLRYAREPRARWLLLASAAFGWAVITRWIYGLAALPFAVLATWAVVRAGPRAIALHALPAAIVGAAILAWVVVPSGTSPTHPFVGTLETYGAETWNVSNIFQRAFLTTGHGQVRYPTPNGLYYAAAPLHPFMLNPLLGLLALPGLVLLARTRRWRALGLLLAWAAAMYLFHAGSTWQNLRYVLAYLPPVAVLGGVGSAALLRARDRRVRWLGAAWLVAGVVFALVAGSVLTLRFIERKNADLALVNWVETQMAPQARLLTFGPTLMFRHYGQRESLELFELSPGDLPPLVAADRPLYLLLDVANVEDQWVGRAPEADYAWLRDHTRLVPLGERDGLTLYRVEQAG